MAEPRYPHIEVPLTGEDGNVFFIMGRVTKAMRRADVPSDKIKAFIDEMMADDYDHALRTVMKWVSVS